MSASNGNIVGIGVDLVEIDRLRASHQKFGETFLSRIFLPSELAYCQQQADPYPFLAGRFAAKEAVSKAFSTGLGNALQFRSIEVAHTPSGAPCIILDEKAQALLKKMGGSRVLISISHTHKTAIAYAMIVA